MGFVHYFYLFKSVCYQRQGGHAVTAAVAISINETVQKNKQVRFWAGYMKIFAFSVFPHSFFQRGNRGRTEKYKFYEEIAGYIYFYSFLTKYLDLTLMIYL